MTGYPVKPVRIWRNAALTEQEDLLAVEEPMQIRLESGPEEDRQSTDLAVTMRTPGNDYELAVGFLFAEGIIKSIRDVRSVSYCENVRDESERQNVVRVILEPGVDPNIKKLRRNFFTTSSCGVCGKTSIDQVHQNCAHIPPGQYFNIKDVIAAPKKLRGKQQVFAHTGGLHATGLFDGNGNLILLREDVGRHNAFDKLIGAALELSLLPLEHYFVVVSGRASFELVQKAVMGGLPLMAAVGAPSSLAADLAAESGMTLLGFVRDGNFNVYCGKQRLKQ